jgi:hypothetical protein
MEMLGAITGLIGAGLQAQAQQDALQLSYAKFNWEKQRANTQDRFAQASRSDQYGNKTGYDPISNEWSIALTPTQKEISQGGEKEQLLGFKDAAAARKVKQAVQARAHDAIEPFKKAAAGYQYDQPRSEGAIRSDITGLLATNEMMKSKADQALIMRQAARLGRGADASAIIQATDQKLGKAENVQNRMLQARNEAVKEFAGRQQLHEAQWGEPMKMWGNLMAQGGDIPGIPKSMMTDSTGAMQQGMLQAFNQGTQGVGGAFDSMIGAAGKSPDLSSVAKLLAGIGSKSSKNSKGQEDDTTYGGTTSFGKASGGDDNYSRNDYGIYDNSSNDFE